MRLALSLFLLNCAAFAIFIVQRPSAEPELRRRDALSAAGHFELSSADPWTYIAARPLYNWSEWHGGELRWVKVLEVANFPALLAAGWAVEFADQMMDMGHLTKSWVRAWVFLAAAAVQWLAAGLLISRARTSRRSARVSCRGRSAKGADTDQG